DYARAVDHYRKAYALSKLPKLLYNIGVALRLKGDKQEALESLQAYIAAEPTSKYVAEAQAEIAGLLKEIAAEGPKARVPVVRPPEPEPETHVEPPPPPTVTVAPPVAPIAPPPAPVVVAPVRDDDRGGIRVAGLVTGGVGVALLATGVVFGLKAKSARNELA